MSDAPKITASDAYGIVHDSLGSWLSTALEDGFECCPVGEGYAREFITMADLMAEIERKQGATGGTP